MLEKLFTSKNRIKILRFLFFETEETHLREIARKLKISPSAVKRELENLEKIGLIKKQKNKIKLNKKNNIAEDLKNIFIKTDYIVYPIKEVLKDKRIKYSLIFGSFARGEFNEDSDIDLLVVGNVSLSEIYKALKPAESRIRKEINPSAWKMNELIEKSKTGFIKDIFSKKIIMIKGEENELRKIVK